MWIREPFTDTWRNRSLRAWLIIWVVVAFGLAGCVVTDEIEFYDKVNLPPRLDSVYPPNDAINTARNNDTLQFTIVVWDPDQDDVGSYEGRLQVIEQLSSSEQSEGEDFNCDVVEYSEPNSSKYEGGVMVTLTCNVVFRLIASDVTSVIVQGTISDRGFLGDELPEEAHQVQVNWTWELFPEDVATVGTGDGK